MPPQKLSSIRITMSQMNILRDKCHFLEIVFVGLCEGFVCLEFVALFFMAAKLIGPFKGCQFFKNVDIFSLRGP